MKKPKNPNKPKKRKKRSSLPAKKAHHFDGYAPPRDYPSPDKSLPYVFKNKAGNIMAVIHPRDFKNLVETHGRSIEEYDGYQMLPEEYAYAVGDV